MLALLGGHEIVVDAVDRTEVADAGDLDRVALDLKVQGRAFRVHLERIRFQDVATIHDAMQGFVDRYGNETIAITSWGLVDCALARSYGDAAASDPNVPTSLGDYLLQLIRSPESRELLVQVCEAFESWLTQSPDWSHGGPRPGCDEPLALALALALALMEKQAAEDVGWPFAGDADNPDAQRTLPFGRVYASAGNQGRPFPMPPAAWPGVMGVAACDASGVLAGYSNVGDFIDTEHVRAPGGWFPLEVNGIEVGYWGTSFAAPHAALALGNGFQTREPVGLHPCRDPAKYPAAP